MNNLLSPVIFLSGAGGGAPDLNVFREDAEDTIRFEAVSYPGWKSYVADGYSAEVFISDLVEEIRVRVPCGPIRIVGLSIGGHFGYAAALRLQAMGREIGGFCAIDSFMTVSSQPSAGWKGRALAQGLELLSKRRFGEFIRFLRSKFWRALVRIGGHYLPNLIRGLPSSRLFPARAVFDPIFVEELNMRLLIQVTAPWIRSLDLEPEMLKAPVTLLRTALTSGDDAAWRRRCPDIEIFEVSGRHHNLFEPENIAMLHETFIAATRGWRDALNNARSPVSLTMRMSDVSTDGASRQ